MKRRTAGGAVPGLPAASPLSCSSVRPACSPALWLALALLAACAGTPPVPELAPPPPQAGPAPATTGSFLALAVRRVPADDPLAAAWRHAPRYEVPLFPQQMTMPELARASVASLSAQALVDSERIAFRLSWSDPSRDAEIGIGRFADQVALQLPLADEPPPTMGSPGGRVQILHWSAAARDPTHPVDELMAEGFGSLTPQATSATTGAASFSAGRWAVVFSRPLRTADPDDRQLLRGEVALVAFAVWQGGDGNVGGRKHWSPWQELELPSPDDP